MKQQNSSIDYKEYLDFLNGFRESIPKQPTRVVYHLDPNSPKILHGNFVIKVGDKSIMVASGDMVSTPLTYDVTVEAVKRFPGNWRIPTEEELQRIYDCRDLIGNFEKKKYWSSTEGRADGIRIVNFRDGNPTTSTKWTPRKCRLVKDI